MAFLKRTQIRTVVLASLKKIADLPSNPEASNFGAMDSFQKHVFLSTLKAGIKSLPYQMNDGSTSNLAFYNIDLMPDSTDDWPTVKDCINWILENQYVVYL